MKRKLFSLLVLLVAAATGAWADAVPTYDLTVDENAHGTVTFLVSGSEVTKAPEGATVTLTITPSENYVLNQAEGQWIAVMAKAPRRAQSNIDVLNGVELTPVVGQENTFTFEMKRASAEFKVTYKKLLIHADISITVPDVTYSGQVLSPDVEVKDGETVLVQGKDYTVTFSNNTNAGTGIATFTGIGTGYAGEKKVEFNVIKAQGSVLFYPSEYTKTFGDANFILKPSVNGDGQLTFKSDNPGIASVDAATGEVTVKSAGKVTIRANMAESDNYFGDTDWCTLVIAPKSLSNGMFAEIPTPVYTGDALVPTVVMKDGETVMKATTDYTLAFEDNVNAGTAKVTATGVGNYQGTATATFTIGQAALTAATLAKTSLVYNQQEQTAQVASVNAGNLEVPAESYEVTGNKGTDVGTYTATITGKGNFKGSVTAQFSIVADANAEFAVTLDPTEYVYDGTQKKPAVTVKDGDAVLVEGTDYTLAYADNTNAGTAKVTATGKGNYACTKTEEFNINKAPLTVKADDAMVISGKQPSFTASYEGFVNNQTEAVLEGELAFACDYTPKSAVGSTFAITPSGLTAKNYDITFVPGTLTVAEDTEATAALIAAREALQTVIGIATNVSPEGLADAIAAARAALTDKDATAESVGQANQTLEAAIKAYFVEVMPKLGAIVQGLNDETLNAAYADAQTTLAKEGVTLQELIAATQNIITAAKAVAPEHLQNLKGYAVKYGAEDAAILVDAALAAIEAGNVSQIIATMTAVKETATPLAQQVLSGIIGYVQAFGLAEQATQAQAALESGNYITMITTAKALFTHLIAAAKEYLPKLGAIVEGLNDETLNAAYADAQTLLAKESITPEELGAAMQNIITAAKAVAPEHLQNLRGYAVKYGAADAVDKVDAALAAIEAGNVSQIIATMTAVKEAATPLAQQVLSGIIGYVQAFGLTEQATQAQAALESGNYITMITTAKALFTHLVAAAKEYLPKLGAIVEGLNDETLNAAYADAQTLLAKESITPEELGAAMQNIITAAKAVAPEHLQNLRGYAVKYGAADAVDKVDAALAAIEAGNVSQIIATMTAVKEAATPLAQQVLSGIIGYVQAFGLTEQATQAQAALESGNYITMITTAKALFTHLIAAAKEYLPKLGAIVEGLNDETLNAAYADAQTLLAKESITPEELGAAMQNIITAAKAVAPEHLQNLRGYAVKYGAADAVDKVDAALAAIEAGNVSQIIATMTAVKEAATPLAQQVLSGIIGYVQAFGLTEQATQAQAALESGNYITMITTAKALFTHLIAAAKEYLPKLGAIVEGLNDETLNAAYADAQTLLAKESITPEELGAAMQNIITAAKAVAPEHLQNLRGYAVKYGAEDAVDKVDAALAAIEAGNVSQIIATMTAVKEAATPLAQQVLSGIIGYVQAFGLTEQATQAQAALESGNYITMITTAKALFTHLIAAAKEYLPKLGAIVEGLNDETLNAAYADAQTLLAKESITPEELGAAMQNIITAAKAVAPEHLQNLKAYAVKYGAADAVDKVDAALAAIEAGNVSQIIATMTAVKEAATPLAQQVLSGIIGYVQAFGLTEQATQAQAALESGNYITMITTAKALFTHLVAAAKEYLPKLGAIVEGLNDETLNAAYADAQALLAKESITPEELGAAMQNIITAAKAVAPEHLQNLRGYAVKYGAADAVDKVDAALAAIEAGNVSQIIATMTAVKEAATPLAQQVLSGIIGYVQAFGLTEQATQAQAALESGNYITMITTAKALFTHLIAAAKEYLPKLGAIVEGLNDETLNAAYADAQALLAKESITPEELGAAMQNIITAAKAVAPEHLQNLKAYAVKYGAADAVDKVDAALAAIEAGNVSQIIATMTAVKEAATPLATAILTQIIGYAQNYAGFADDVTAAQAAIEGGNYITMITTAKALYAKLMGAANDYVTSVKAIPTEGKNGVDELNAAILAAEQALAAQDSDFSAINTAISNLVAAVKAFNEANKPEPAEGIIYSWESPAGEVIEAGGTIAYVNGDGDRLNYKSGDYYTICLNGKKANLNDETASANAGHMVITLNKALEEGDVIAMTAYINKNESKKASAYIVFENGTSMEGEVYSDEANIDPAFGGVPTTKTMEVPAAAAGSKTVTLTRSQAGTNLFITKLEISEKSDLPTGIKNLTPALSKGEGVYNLNGQKVNKAQKGLFIINGKKVVIK